MLSIAGNIVKKNWLYFVIVSNININKTTQEHEDLQERLHVDGKKKKYWNIKRWNFYHLLHLTIYMITVGFTCIFSSSIRDLFIITAVNSKQVFLLSFKINKYKYDGNTVEIVQGHVTRIIDITNLVTS